MQECIDSPVDEGLFNPAHSERVFAHLAEIAGALLIAGENVIVDATLTEQARRRAILELAARLGVTVRIFYCIAPVKVLRQRVQARESSRKDVSEATLDVLKLQLDIIEPPTAPEPITQVDTTQEFSTDRLRFLANAINQG